MTLDYFLGILLWILAYILTFKTITLAVFSFTHYRNQRTKLSSKNPLVSIIVPCYNEKLVIENCLESLSKQTYQNFEILVVDDGSKDNTAEIVKSLPYSNVKLLQKVNGGKASALNYGISQSNGEIIVSMDADSIFLPTTLEKLVAPFDSPKIAAVSGNIKVSNRDKMITKNQALEYISGLNIQRRTFAHIHSMQIISGAIGAFRKSVLLEVGGYSTDTIVEDMDITVTIASKGYRIEYIGDAIAYTEAPESLKDFYKQRYRWIYGGFEVISKHIKTIFNPKSGGIGMIGLPYIMTSLTIDMLVTFILLYISINTIFFQSSFNLIPLLITVVTLQAILFYYTVKIDKEDSKLPFLTLFYVMIYTQFINLITMKALVDYSLGKKTSWNKVARLGKNKL